MSPNQRLPVVKAVPGWFTSALRAGLWLLGALCLFVCLRKKRDYATLGELVMKLTCSLL